MKEISSQVEGSEKQDMTPLTFLTIFCKAGKGRGETKAQEGREVRRHEGSQTLNTPIGQEAQTGFIFILSLF